MEADAGVRARSDSPWSPGVFAPDSSTHSRLVDDVVGDVEPHDACGDGESTIVL